MDVAERRCKVEELWPTHTDREIADLLDIEKHTVWNDVAKLGLRKGHKALSARWKRDRRGPGNPNWKGGHQSKREGRISTRHLVEYKEFVESIKERDGGQCVRCESPENILVHHIVPETEAPELLMDPDNAETLCRSCHIKHHRPRRYKSKGF